MLNVSEKQIFKIELIIYFIIISMSIRNDQISQILQSENRQIKVLQAYILRIQRLCLNLIRQNQQMNDELGSFRTQNQQLRAERLELQLNLQSSKETVNSIEHLFKQFTGTNTNLSLQEDSSLCAANPAELQQSQEINQ